jgi:hypothetical protein
MKKALHVITFVFAAGALMAQTIPNGNFESWNENTWMDPAGGYYSSDDLYVPSQYSPNVVRTTNAYHGSYAIQLTTVKVGVDTLQAFVTNGNPGGANPTGGAPYSQKPTGIRLYYECNIMPGDSATIVAVFKKSGSVIGTYGQKLTGVRSSYTLLVIPFSPALAINPDTLIFAFTPSNLLINNNYKGIPGSTLTIDSVTFTGGVIQPNTNGDFENWIDDTAAYPTGWTGAYPGVYRTTAAYAGNYALELKTQGPSLFSSKGQPGYATTGKNYGNSGGYPYTLLTDTLEFYYKYAPAGGPDTAGFNIEFKKNDVSVGGTGAILTAQAAYTLKKIGFTIGSTPDSAIIAFASTLTASLDMVHKGSTLLVDNLFFKSQPLSIPVLLADGSIRIYPNPVVNSFTLNADGFSGSIRALKIYDMSGRLVESFEYPSGLNNNIEHYDISRYSAGLYLIHITTNSGDYYQKISKL